MKKILCLVLAMLVGVGLSACGATEASSAPSPSASASAQPTEMTMPSVTPAPSDMRPVTLETASMFGGTDANARTYQALTKAFLDGNPHVTVLDDSTSSNEQWKTKIAADFASGNEPDVIYFFTDKNAANVLAAGQFVTIEDIRAVYPDYARDITPDALRNAAAPDGTQLAVPTVGFYEGLYCNKDLFDRYGAALPTDWDKLMKAIEIFRDNKVIPVAVSLGEVPHYWIEHLIFSAGGVPEHSLNPTEPPESWVTGLAMFQTLRNAGAFPQDTDVIKNADTENLFKTKKAAMQLDGSWFAGGVTDKDNTVILPFPVMPGGQKEPGDILSGFSSGFYITKKAWSDPDKREAAVHFVMTHTSADAISLYWKGAGMPSANCEQPAGLTPLMQSGAAMAAAAQNAGTPIDSRINPEAWKVLVRDVSDISNGKKTAQDVLSGALAKNRS